MNVSNEIARIKNADKNIKMVCAQDKIVFAKKILSAKCVVKFKVTIPNNVGTITIMSDSFRNKTLNASSEFSVEVLQGDQVRASYRKRNYNYEFFSDITNIVNGIAIETNCSIWVGFKKKGSGNIM